MEMLYYSTYSTIRCVDTHSQLVTTQINDRGIVAISHGYEWNSDLIVACYRFAICSLVTILSVSLAMINRRVWHGYGPITMLHECMNSMAI